MNPAHEKPALVDRGLSVLHCVNAAATTWFGLARAVCTEIDADPDRVQPATPRSFPSPPLIRPTRSWTLEGVQCGAGPATAPAGSVACIIETLYWSYWVIVK
jgi:RmlD substrate binding domain